MKFIADLHLHSKFSQATSSRMEVENLARWAETKGIKVLGTGDFTHPGWLKELKHNLEPAQPGLFELKDSGNPTRFLLSSEISCVYSKKGETRKIHILVFAPDFETVEKIKAQLSWEGKLESDGRPTLGMDAEELAKIVLETNPECLIVPAHLWTPWFSLFGSRSGFDSIKECFEDYSKYIYAGETGLSSDPPMNWRLSALDRITLVSNSDAHSPENLGREANVFDTELSYKGIVGAIKSKDPEKFLYTIEFYPQEGKYHYDGHRKCDTRCSPQQSKKYNNICPVCGKPLTVGVLNRVNQLADRKLDFKPEGAIPFKHLIPLAEIIAEAKGVGKSTKQVEREYQNLIERFGSEFEVLLNIPRSDLGKVTFPEIVEGVIRVRKGQVHITPGFDGVYGQIDIFNQGEQEQISPQETLF